MDESSTAVKLLINLSKAFYQMADYSEAQGYFDKASTLNPDLTSQFAYLGNGDGATRASEISGSQTIIFIEE
jgi:tetratricopeptide (TPR) repeat protein